MIRVAILADQPRCKHDITTALQRHGLVVLGTLDAAAELPRQLGTWVPEAVVLAAPFAGAPAAQWLSELRRLAPEAALLVVSRDTAAAQVRQLFCAGADDVLALPRDLNTLPQALRDAVQRRREAAHPGGGAGRVVAVWSPKGGTGCSLLAAGLALALQTRQQRRTLLADLTGPFGGAERLVGLQDEPERTLADLFRVIGELSPDHLLQACTAHESGLALLAAPRLSEPLGGLLPEHVSAVAGLCGRLFERTVLDVPSLWHPTVAAALAAADRLLLVLTPDVPAVRAAQAALDLLPALRREQKTVGLVVNRLCRRSELQPDAIGRLLDLPVVGRVRANYWPAGVLAQRRSAPGCGRAAPAAAPGRRRRPLEPGGGGRLRRRRWKR